MANTAKEMPTQNRSDSEIGFVLRHAGRRKGPELLRDMARAEREPEAAPRETKSPARERRSKTII